MGIIVGMNSRSGGGGSGGTSTLNSRVSALETDLTEVWKAIEELRAKLNIMIPDEDNTEKIDTFNEIINFLDGQKNSDTIINTIKNNSDITVERSEDNEDYIDIF